MSQEVRRFLELEIKATGDPEPLVNRHNVLAPVVERVFREGWQVTPDTPPRRVEQRGSQMEEALFIAWHAMWRPDENRRYWKLGENTGDLLYRALARQGSAHGFQYDSVFVCSWSGADLSGAPLAAGPGRREPGRREPARREPARANLRGADLRGRRREPGTCATLRREPGRREPGRRVPARTSPDPPVLPRLPGRTSDKPARREPGRRAGLVGPWKARPCELRARTTERFTRARKIRLGAERIAKANLRERHRSQAGQGRPARRGQESHRKSGSESAKNWHKADLPDSLKYLRGLAWRISRTAGRLTRKGVITSDKTVLCELPALISLGFFDAL